MVDKRTRLAISGQEGRMSSTIRRLALSDRRFEVKVILVNPEYILLVPEVDGALVTADLSQIQMADVWMEFTTPKATVSHLAAAVLHRIPMVIGTTGLNEEQVKQVREASGSIPILFSPNMSLGAQYVLKTAARMAAELGPGWDIAGVETHHRRKTNELSGTAKRGAQLILEATGREIPFRFLRMGSVPGKHTFYFARDGEIITITHEAESPVIFAKGALDLAEKLVDRSPGLYEPTDLL